MIDPTKIEVCPDCRSKADTCVLCLVCIRCAPDGHDEGCDNEGDEYTPEQLAAIEAGVKAAYHPETTTYQELPWPTP